VVGADGDDDNGSDSGSVYVYAPPDADGDGVLDADDLCDETVLPEPEPEGWKKNHYIADGSGNFVDPNGREAGVTIADTGGCSDAQIVEAAGLGQGHARFGITHSALLDWVESLNSNGD
jgi:hypothetical protein